MSNKQSDRGSKAEYSSRQQLPGARGGWVVWRWFVHCVLVVGSLESFPLCTLNCWTNKQVNAIGQTSSVLAYSLSTLEVNQVVGVCLCNLEDD